MRVPSAFATLVTSNTLDECLGLLSSLSLHHPGGVVFVACDSASLPTLTTLETKVVLHCDARLDKYAGLSRTQMEQWQLWLPFMLEKLSSMRAALRLFHDVLFLDADIVVLNPIDLPYDADVEVGLSPAFIANEVMDKYGHFNGGMVWTRSVAVLDAWERAAASSRFYEQSALEELDRQFRAHHFSPAYNVQFWRTVHADAATVLANIVGRDGNIFYGNEPLRFIHTHFQRNHRDAREASKFNQHICEQLARAGRTTELAIIDRIRK